MLPSYELGSTVGDFKMTESFAGAMVTVIPIILLVAVVEVQQRGRLTVETLTKLRLAQETSEPGAGTAALLEARMRKPPMWAPFLWGTLSAAHVVAEAMLIFWLAGSERSPGTWQAPFVAYTAAVGFVVVILTAVLSPYSQAMRIRREAPWARRPR